MVAAVSNHRRLPDRPRLLVVLALAGLLLVAGALRFYGLNWDQYQHVHPDERFIVWVADTVRWPGSLGAALDPATSPLNPFRWPPGAGNLAGQARNYAYGHLPLYLLVAVAGLGQAAAQALARAGLSIPTPLLHLASYGYLAVTGRAISVVCDLGTLLLVFGLARRLYGRGPAEGDRSVRTGTVVGLLAAAAYALAVLPIQLSHYYAVDMVMTLCVVATVAAAVAAAETGAPRTWLLAGALAGLAVGSKFSAALLAVPLAVAASYGLPGEGEEAAAVRLYFRRLALVLVAAVAVFVLTNPFAVIEARAYLRNLAAQNAMITGRMDAPYTRQFIGTAPYWYDIRQLAQWGLGWPLGVAAWCGLGWAVVQAVRRRATPAQAVVLAWAAPYFAITGVFYAKFPRYLAPLLPFLLIFAAGAGLALYRCLSRHWGRRGRVAALAGGTTVLLVTAAWALAFAGVYGQTHPWIQASNWIYRNVPAGSKLLGEQWDDALPLAMDEIAGHPPKRTYRQVLMALYDPDTRAKLDLLVAELSSADYVILASNRLWRPIGRLPERYPLGSAYYRLLFDGTLGYTEVADFTSYPRLFGLTIADDNADESFTVYDHPHPRIFANTGRLSAERLRSRLLQYLPLQLGATDGQPRFSVGANLVFARSVFARLDFARRSFAPRVGAEAGERKATGPDNSAPNLKHTPAGQQPPPGKAPGLAAEQPVPITAVPTPLALRGVWQNGLADSALVCDLAWRVGLSPAGLCSISPELLAPGAPAQTAPPGGLPQAPAAAQPITLMPGLADFRWDRFASERPVATVIVWWLALSLFGWLAWPLLFPILGGLRDRGYGLARLAGWLVVGWVHWLGVSLGLWQNRAAAIALVLALLALAGLGAAIRQRRALAAFWARRAGLLLAEEALFAAAFLAFVAIRLFDPDLWQPWNGGEKFMEFAFLNAILRSAHFPPYDPYFAGGAINYYYYGLYLVSLPIKLTGIFPEVAFNVAVPGLFAQAVLAAFSAGASLARRPGAAVRLGLLAVVLALLLANGTAFSQALTLLAQVGGAPPGAGPVLGPATRGAWLVLTGAGHWPGFDYWAVSRVIPYTINEFPFWSFLFADLHPHLIAMPVGLAVAGLALNWLLLHDRRRANTKADAPEGANLGFAQRRRRALIPTPCRPKGHGARIAPANRDPDFERAPDEVARFHVGANLVFARRVFARRRESANTGPWPPESVRPAPPAGEHEAMASASRAPELERGPDEVAVAPAAPAGGRGRPWLPALGRGALLVIMLGALGPANTWDLPVYLLLVAGVFLVLGWRDRRPVALLLALVQVVVVGGLAGLVYLPFYLHYHAVIGGQSGPFVARYLALVRASSALRPWFDIWGFFLFLAVSFVALELFRGRVRPLRVIWVLVAAGLGLTVFMAGRPAAALAGVPLALAVGLAWRRNVPPRTVFVLLLLALGLGILAGTELLYVRDFLDGGDWERMNTVFKFGMPAWLTLAVAGAAAVDWLWGELGRRNLWLGSLWQVAVVFLVLAGLVFLPLGTQARVADRFPGPRPAFGTLDGSAYMKAGSYDWPDDRHTIALASDYDAIHWLLDHVEGAPVVAEAPAGSYVVDGAAAAFDYYRAGGLRVASLTGFPTFLGQHQVEQRDAEEVAVRGAVGQEFFAGTDLARTRLLLRDLRVSYIYVGQLERLLFPAASLAKFDTLAASGELAIVYRNAQVTIYRVVEQTKTAKTR